MYPSSCYIVGKMHGRSAGCIGGWTDRCIDAHIYVYIYIYMYIYLIIYLFIYMCVYICRLVFHLYLHDSVGESSAGEVESLLGVRLGHLRLINASHDTID